MRRSQSGTRWGPKEDPPCVPWRWPHGVAHLVPGSRLCKHRLDITVLSQNRLYKGPLMRSRDGAVDKHKIHNMDMHTPRIWGEMLLELLLVAPLTPSTPSPSAPWWRGSSSPLDYGIVEVTCIKLSLVLQCLESHEPPIIIVTIFVLPLWWIFCLWDAKMFLSLMYE
jgi:hypothetical protein